MQKLYISVALLASRVVVLAIALGFSSSCSRTAPPPPANVVVAFATALPLDHADEAWNAAPQYVVQLLPQDIVEPRSKNVSTREVRVQAMSDGQDLMVRLVWADASQNDFSKPGAFPDACAVQLPDAVTSTVPAPQMGEPGRLVRFSYWNASRQAIVDGRPDAITAIYPNAAPDHYPFQAKSLEKDPSAKREMSLRYAPAKALGNPVSDASDTAVEDLVADGPGTLRGAPAKSKGHGTRTPTGWAVVIQRPLPDGFSPQIGTQIAFAVWDGEKHEVGSRKMRSGWIPLTMKEPI